MSKLEFTASNGRGDDHCKIWWKTVLEGDVATIVSMTDIISNNRTLMSKGKEVRLSLNFYPLNDSTTNDRYVIYG